MTSDILKRAAEAVEGVTLGPWAVCDRWNVSGPKYEVMNGSIMVRDDAESDANARFIAEARTLIPDMAAAIAERDAENARLTARAEAAEAQVANAGAVTVEACAQIADGYHQRALEWAKKIRGLEQYIDETDSSRIAADIRALSPIAAAAQLLIPVFEEKHRDYMTSKGRDPDHYGSRYSMAVQDLRALAEQEKADG